MQGIDASQVEHTTTHDFVWQSSQMSQIEYESSENLSKLQADEGSNDVMLEQTSTLRYEMRATANPLDCVELQEIVIERLDEEKKEEPIPSVERFPSERAIEPLTVMHQTCTSSKAERGSLLADDVESVVRSSRERIDQSRSVSSKSSSSEMQFVGQSSAAAAEVTDHSFKTIGKGHLNTGSSNVVKTTKTTFSIPPDDWRVIIQPFMTETTVERSPFPAEILNPTTAHIESETTRGAAAAATAAASVGTGKSLSGQSSKGQFEGSESISPSNLLPERFSLVQMVQTSANRMPIQNQTLAENHNSGNQPIMRSPAFAQDQFVKYTSALSPVMSEATSARDEAHPVGGKSTARSPIARQPRTVPVSAMSSSSKGGSAQRVSARFRGDTNTNSVFEAKATINGASEQSASLGSVVVDGSRALDFTQASRKTHFLPSSEKSPTAHPSQDLHPTYPSNHERSKHGAC